MRPRPSPRRYLAAALIQFSMAGAGALSAVEGVARAIDGDTLELAGERIRLWGIDAPERSQTCRLAAQAWRCGQDAAKALARLLEAGPIECEPRDRDRYGRLVARCTAAGSDIAAVMVRDGWALDFARYSDGAYLADQQVARAARAGLWRGQFVPPWQWRHEH
jgi:endonuclease YncB( thermonuclease family)